MYTKRFQSHLLPFLILTLLVILLQYFILKPHLKYAFADVDWMFLLTFKEVSALYHDPISHFINSWERWGIYTYQVYYIGLIEKFFGMDYKNFQIVTEIFKVIATLSIYPMIFLITKSRMVAFLTTLIYSVAYSSVGVMYTVVTSGLFVAIPVMNAFFIWYFYLINKGRNTIKDILLGVILFIMTLLLATERMYPLIPTIVLIEFFWWLKRDFSKNALFQGLKRLSVFLILFLAIFLYKPSMFTLHSGNTEVTLHKFVLGNWQVVLSPIISFGSLFVPKDYWTIFGVANVKDVYSYISSFLTGPMVVLIPVTIFLSIFIAQKKLKFVLTTLALTFFSSLVVYILSIHQLSIPESDRMHFDLSNIIPALIGSYVICFTFVLFKEWLDGNKKDNLLIILVAGLAISLLFIIVTLFPADYVLIFTDVHRYLTIPAIGSSLMIAGLMTIIFNKLKISRATKPFAFIIFLFLIPLIIFNAKVITKSFDYDLNYEGTDAAGHIRMKNKLWSYLNNFSTTEPSLFYFDESQDHDNGYFDETTVMAGFGYWMRFRGGDIVDSKLSPMLFRSNLICQEVRSTCLSKVKEYVATQNGGKGILYAEKFYKSKNIYAFRFINRDIVDIKPEVVKIIGLE